ncbi:hypothetical protein HDU99_008037 [Rhizoclosmatium hyalinum]|nr:hypothetical protein HDU99_008037 [Rhizoclosmatium hyalinum]
MTITNLTALFDMPGGGGKRKRSSGSERVPGVSCKRSTGQPQHPVVNYHPGVITGTQQLSQPPPPPRPTRHDQQLQILLYLQKLHREQLSTPESESQIKVEHAPCPCPAPTQTQTPQPQPIAKPPSISFLNLIHNQFQAFVHPRQNNIQLRQTQNAQLLPTPPPEINADILMDVPLLRECTTDYGTEFDINEDFDYGQFLDLQKMDD